MISKAQCSLFSILDYYFLILNSSWGCIGIESLFCSLLFPVIITEIGEGKLFFACKNFRFSFRKIGNACITGLP